MTPGARISAAVEVLSDIEARYRPVAEALRDWGLSHRFAGSRDRAAIGNIVYDALRRQRSLAAAMGANTPRALSLGVVGRAWGLGAQGVAEALASEHSPPPLSDDERRRLDAGMPALTEAERADAPDWLVPSLTRAFGGRWVDEMEAMAERPPLDVRANRLKADREKVLKALSRYGAVETPYAPDGVRIAATIRDERHPHIQSEVAFQRGWFEVQDEGSQLSALMVGARPGEQVLDLCAGGGGKALALAAAMSNKGQVHATDIDRRRLAPIFDRLRRAGTRNVQVHEPGDGLERLLGKLDRVLVDAPCSGSGTWRRHPDAKWRLTKDQALRRVGEQFGLLQNAAGFVRQGGLLVYVTCSVLPEENEDQVQNFIASRPDFQFLTPREMIAAALEPDTAERLADAVGSPGPGAILTPRRTGTDGFYVAAMRRV
jgi:16S rRNA (cytosine967-C5)-methyltransferase